jgi:hypothetical protein
MYNLYYNTETEYSPHTDLLEELACHRSSYSSLQNVAVDKGVDPDDWDAEEGGPVVVNHSIGLLLQWPPRTHPQA